LVAESQTGKQKQSIAFAELSDVEFGVAPFLLNAVATSGLPVTYLLLSGPATLVGNIVTVDGIGEVVIEADQDGNDLFEMAEPASVRFDVLKASQTIAFSTLSNKKIGDSPFSITATASSGLPVHFKIISGPATLSGNTVMLTKVAGVVVVEAAQDGNDRYRQAMPVRQSFTVSEVVSEKQNQTIMFGTLAYKTFNSPSFGLVATATSGLPVNFRVVSGPVKITGSQVTISGVGSAVVEAVQEGNGEYHTAPSVQRSFTIGKGSQILSFPNIANRQLTEGSIKLQATSSAGLQVGYRVVSGPAAVVGDVVTFTGTGLVNIEATQKGNENYTAAFPLYRSFAILASGEPVQQQTIDFPI
jgi:hypothetical protein